MSRSNGKAITIPNTLRNVSASHILGYVGFLIAVNIHVSAALPYTLFAALIYLLDLLIRIINTRHRSATITPLTGGMTMVQVHGIAEGWRSGQHVWLRVFKGGRMAEIHPFTIANAPASSSPLP